MKDFHFSRRGLAWRIVAASGAIITLQGLYLVAYNMAKETPTAGLAAMYMLTFAPLGVALYLLSPASHAFRTMAVRRLKARS